MIREKSRESIVQATAGIGKLVMPTQILPPVKGAAVGWTGTQFDKIFRAQCENTFLGRRFAWDVIDLNAGRDFLAEQGTFDIISLHNIFSGAYMGVGNLSGRYCSSPHQSQAAWRKALLAANPTIIMASGGDDSEVGAMYIGVLPGYLMSQMTARLTVWRRG